MSSKEVDSTIEKSDVAPPAPSTTTPALLQDPRQPISIPVETTIRITFGAFCGYCLAYSDSSTIDSVLPNSLKWLVGLLAPVLVMRVPPLAATVMGSLVIFYTAMMFALCSVTCLLYAVTVSDGLFVAMVAIWTFWMSGLRYGPTGKGFNILMSTLCVFFAMVGLGLHRSIRDGISITISRPLLRQLTFVELPERLEEALESEEVREALIGEIIDKVAELSQQTILERAEGLLEDVTNFVGIIQMAFTALAEILVTGCTDLNVPNGHLAGRIVTICLDIGTGDLKINIPGGAWLIETCWTAGVMHPLAVFPNIIVVCSWVFVCVYVSPLFPLPAIRTLRFNLSRIMLPQTLNDAGWYLQADHARKKNDDDTDIDVDQWIDDERQVRKRLIGAVQTLHGGTIGLATALEPRIFAYRCGIPRNTFMPLKELTTKVQMMALKALAAKVIDPVQSQEVLAGAIVSIEQTATLLADPRKYAMTATHHDCKLTGAATEADAATAALDDNEKHKPKDDGESSLKNADPLGFEELSKEITEATSEWLESMYPTSYYPTDSTWPDGTKHVLISFAIFMLPSLVFLGRLLQILCLPFLVALKRGYAKDNWDTAKVFHCIKFTAGFTALVASAVYWDKYHAFTVTEEDNPGYELIRGNPPSSFAGWDLIAYVYATMPTTEGTVKKCVFRICGTCVGGFSAWALIQATGKNAIGSVAWLTITTAIGAYVSVDKSGGAARFGASEDFGYGGFYLVLTQTVIVLEYHAGLGEGDDLVANRITANIIGICMAVFMSLIPPRVMGSSPKYTKLLFDEACRGLSQAARIFIDGGIEGSEHSMRELQSSFLKNSNALRADARFLLVDAKRMNKLPFFHVDAELDDELDHLTITCAGIASVMGTSADILRFLESQSQSEAPGAALLGSGDLQDVLKAIAENKTHVDLDVDPRMGGSPAENLIASFEILQSRLTDHLVALEKLE